ncbi:MULTISPECIES: hypothetical protein [Burkholderia]|nr:MULTISPECIES: hypothetical protein [Burkholderia]
MKSHIHTALIILGVFAVTAFVQKNVITVPVLGPYLPGGAAA